MGIKFGGLVSTSVEVKVSRSKFCGWVERLAHTMCGLF